MGGAVLKRSGVSPVGSRPLAVAPREPQTAGSADASAGPAAAAVAVPLSRSPSRRRERERVGFGGRHAEGEEVSVEHPGHAGHPVDRYLRLRRGTHVSWRVPSSHSIVAVSPVW